MTDKSIVLSIVLMACIISLVLIALFIIPKNTSTSTVCDSGKVIIYEDGSAACVTKIKGAGDVR